MLIGQFAIGIYGGYFGGAVGLMMMALWALTGEFELGSLNSPRAMLATAANTAAVFAFIIAGAVWWPPTLVMLVGGTLGSYIGARIGRSLSPRRVHVVTLSFAFLITIAFFVRAYWPVTK